MSPAEAPGEAIAGRPAPLGPVAVKQRIAALDVARGAAVLGVLIMNIWAFGGPQAFFDYPVAIAGRDGQPVLTWAVMHTLFEGSQRTLLSLLFGAGALLALQRFESRADARTARALYYRRTGLLIALGLVNAYLFLWPADILFVYGLAALCLYPLRHLRSTTLALLVLAALAVPTGLRWMDLQSARDTASAAATALERQQAGEPLDEAGQQAIAAWEARLRKARPAADDKDIAGGIRTMQSGSIAEIARRQARASLVLQTIVTLKWWFLDALAMMIVGMLLLRSGVLTTPQPRARLARLAAAGFAVGLPLAAWHTGVLLASDFHPVQAAIAKFGYDLRRLGMALGYLGLVLLLCASSAGAPIRAGLAAAGRMALTNYLAQSILCALLFYGFGFGLYGRLTGYQLYGVVAGIWALEIAWSLWWLRRFQIGPFEWVWRSLTYRRRQPWHDRIARPA